MVGKQRLPKKTNEEPKSIQAINGLALASSDCDNIRQDGIRQEDERSNDSLGQDSPHEITKWDPISCREYGSNNSEWALPSNVTRCVD